MGSFMELREWNNVSLLDLKAILIFIPASFEENCEFYTTHAHSMGESILIMTREILVAKSAQVHS